MRRERHGEIDRETEREKGAKKEREGGEERDDERE